MADAGQPAQQQLEAPPATAQEGVAPPAAPHQPAGAAGKLAVPPDMPPPLEPYEPGSQPLEAAAPAPPPPPAADVAAAAPAASAAAAAAPAAGAAAAAAPAAAPGAAPAAAGTPTSPTAVAGAQPETRKPVRAYLEETVVPLLMQGMMELNRKRPADPIDFLCTYLQQHNPKRQQKAA